MDNIAKSQTYRVVANILANGRFPYWTCVECLCIDPKTGDVLVRAISKTFYPRRKKWTQPGQLANIRIRRGNSRHSKHEAEQVRNVIVAIMTSAPPQITMRQGQRISSGASIPSEFKPICPAFKPRPVSVPREAHVRGFSSRKGTSHG